ncbi:MAG: hypothetical protein GY793_11490 [Proteobacteria bacterium]|nr:hypothetical protein [Pseudomonadota bacterium]
MNENINGEHRLWLDHEWYIPVDNNGMCISACAEGSLGFIVQLHKEEKGADWKRAIKLPRLMGETHRENAYINELLTKEAEIAMKIALEDHGTRGLLSPFSVNRTKARINTERGSKEAREWNKSILFICFEKGKKPRFNLVKRDGDEKPPKVFLSDVEDFPIKSIEQYDKIAESTYNEEDIHWEQTVFIEYNDKHKSITGELTIFNESEAIEATPMGKTWYTWRVV